MSLHILLNSLIRSIAFPVEYSNKISLPLFTTRDVLMSIRGGGNPISILLLR